VTSTEGQREELPALLADASARFAAVAGQVRDPAMPVRQSMWTAAELVAHVAGGLETYARYLDGDPSPAVDVTDVSGGSLTASNCDRLAAEPERDIEVLLGRAAVGSERVCEHARQRSLDELVPWHGRQEPLRCLLASAIAEQLVHGRDLALTIGAAWPIERHEAVLVLDNLAPLLPVLVDREATRTLDTTIRVKLRGGPAIPLHFDHGSVNVSDAHAQPDATVSADPVSFLLVAYGRRNPWQEIARGHLVAWGRRPWVALKLTSYLARP
jgi:Mycothiol maleylpyruvate isomerase N-terminal domain/SCP-2 sterol transfer family